MSSRSNISQQMIVGLIVCILFAAGNRAIGQCTFDWRPGDAVPGVALGSVYALTTWDPDGAGPEPEVFVAGGAFKVAGNRSANCIATWNGSVWQPLASGVSGPPNGYSSPVVTALADFNGEIVAAGAFTMADGVSANYIARWNGSRWQPLGSGTNGVIDALAVYNGELIAGGAFTTAGDVGANYVARWNGTSWLPMGTGLGSRVHALCLYNGQLVAGEYIIAQWDGANWQALGSADETVNALATYNGDLIAGGHFESIGGIQGGYRYIARWNGSAWQSMGGMDYFVSALSTYGGDLIAGGGFSLAGGATCNHIARWNGTSWSPLVAQSGNVSPNGVVSALTAWNGELIFGGDFDSVTYRSGDVIVEGPPTIARVGRWNGTAVQAAASGFDFSIYAMTVYNGKLIAGGLFSVAPDGNAADSIASWSPAEGWQPLGKGLNGPARALAVYNGLLMVGGNFSMAGSVPANNIAAWDGSGWHALSAYAPWDAMPALYRQHRSHRDPSRVDGVLGLNGVVAALTVYNGELIAGGYFTAADVIVPANHVAGWNGRWWQALGEGVDGPDTPFVDAMTVHNGELAVGGSFNSAGGVSANQIAHWNGISWSPYGGGSPASVWTLCVYAGDLIEGGLGYEGGVPSVARWDGANWQPLGTGLTSPYPYWSGVGALTTYQGALVATGWFSSAGHSTASWNGTSWQGLGVGLPDTRISTFGTALTTLNSELIVGGRFYFAGGLDADHVSAFLARWGPNCALGDMNCDGAINGADISPFTAALLDPTGQTICSTHTANMNGDTNPDGTSRLDESDIPGFVAAVLGS